MYDGRDEVIYRPVLGETAYKDSRPLGLAKLCLLIIIIETTLQKSYSILGTSLHAYFSHGPIFSFYKLTKQSKMHGNNGQAPFYSLESYPDHELIRKVQAA